ASHVRHLAELTARLDPEPTTLAEVSGGTAGLLGNAFEELLGNLDPEVEAVLVEYRRKNEDHLLALRGAATAEEFQSLQKQHPARLSAARLLQLGRERAGTPTAYQALVLTLLVGAEVVPRQAAQGLIGEAGDRLL